MENILVGDNLRLSRIVLGHWRLADWKLSVKEILKYTHQAIEIGINSFDNADIYGNYSCEKLFGEAINQELYLRKEIKIIPKCGLKLLSNKLNILLRRIISGRVPKTDIIFIGKFFFGCVNIILQKVLPKLFFHPFWTSQIHD